MHFGGIFEDTRLGALHVSSGRCVERSYWLSDSPITVSTIFIVDGRELRGMCGMLSI